MTIVYQIVKIGAQPGNESSSNEGATCAAWAESEDRQSAEVIAIDLSTGEITRRYTPAECERIAGLFRNPPIKRLPRH